MESEEWWRRPQSTQKQNEKETEAHEVFPTEYNNSNSAPKTNVTTRTACIKNTYPRDSVLSNETDEPKMTKAQCNLRRRCRWLQRVRDGERGVVAAAPINPKTQSKKTADQEVFPTEYNNSNSAPKTNVTTTTACVTKTYHRDQVFSNETNEPKMTKAQCNLRSRCRSLQRVRDGE